MCYSKLKIERVKKNWSQTDLSKNSGVCRLTISNIENGKIDSTQLGTLKRIAAALDSTVQELFLS